MSYEDKEVRDFCYELINIRKKINSILVCDWCTGWSVTNAMGPPVAMVSPEFITKLKKAMGIADEVLLTRVKGLAIVYLTPRRPPQFESIDQSITCD